MQINNVPYRYALVEKHRKYIQNIIEFLKKVLKQ